METGLAAVGTVFAQVMTWTGDLVTTIVSTPLLLLPVGFYCAYKVMKLAKKFIGA